MSETKFTPGPWSFRRNYGSSLDFFGEDGARAIVCEVRLINQEANAHLIAAAPELYEALEMMIIGSCACAIPHAGERAVLEKAVINARFALAKARGE